MRALTIFLIVLGAASVCMGLFELRAIIWPLIEIASGAYLIAIGLVGHSK